MATEKLSSNNNANPKHTFDYSSLGRDYGVSLKFNLDAKDFVNKKIQNDMITEQLSGTKWKFHFHDLSQTPEPLLYNGHYCWNFEAAFLSPVTHIDALKDVTLNDDYTYCILIHWRDIMSMNDDEHNQNHRHKNLSNGHWLSTSNHSIQQNITKSHKRTHHWRIPLRARIINENNHEYLTTKTVTTHSQFVDWITLKSSTTSRTSSIGLRTNYYNEKYHTVPSRSTSISSTNSVHDVNTINNKKAGFIGCENKLDNTSLYSEWQMIVITGRKEAFDGPDSSFWIGTKHQSIRKIGGIRASVPRSCLYSIGSDANSKETKYCSGKIAKVLIYDGVLCKPDIQRLYTHIFAMNPDRMRCVISKSQKWYSLHHSPSKRRKNSKYYLKYAHSNKAKDKDNKVMKESKSSSSLSSSVSSSSSSVSSSMLPKLDNTVNSDHFDNLLPTNKERRGSVSSMILESITDEKIRKKIEKQAVINEMHEDDNESSSSSSEADHEGQGHGHKREDKAKFMKKKDSLSSTTQSRPTTPSFSVASPIHEKLLPQLEADILEQQQIMQREQKKKENNSDDGIIGRFVKNIRNLTNGSTPLEDEDDAAIQEVINIKHKTRIHSVIDHEGSARKIEKDPEKEKEKEKETKGKQSKDTKSTKGTLKMPPLRDSVQHVVLYETSHRFFLVGSNLECTKYWILKIDRKAPPVTSTATTTSASAPSQTHRDSIGESATGTGTGTSTATGSGRRPPLHIVEDRTVYNGEEITTILSMIRAGNKSSGGLTQCISGYGIVGFIRFLEGYYIVLITEREKVGVLGHHSIYKINKTAMIPVTPSRLDSNVTSKRLRSDETRYKNLFSVIDLNREFYFSYSYDLSRTLQWNMCNHFRRKPAHIFVWNEFLLKPLRQSTASNTWMLPIIHGYFESKICSIYGRGVSLTLISRRSKQFAGTRYLKRGINDLGHSANDIETEQILHDRVGGHCSFGQFTSHVQMRASIPLFWVQDSNPMVPKPDIYIQKVDPSAQSVRKHFESIFKRYGAPVLVINLIKHQESHPRETIVGREFKRAMSFINSFLPSDYRISYVAWDFKDCQRHKARSVVDELTKFAEWSLQRTGFFHSNPTNEALSAFGRRTYDISENDVDIQPLRYFDSDEHNEGGRRKHDDCNGNYMKHHVLLRAFRKSTSSKRRIYDLGCFQKGVLRSNCIDSLDRTNVAQFIVGKCALGYQLYALGILDAPWLDRESDFIRVLLQMYERMGDCLALQYGGSQMHRQMKKDHAEARSMAPALYKHKDPGTRPREMFVSFVRHYQNNFQDNVKQDAMNLFLGTFRPDPSVGSYRLWELGSDYYLHNRLVTIHKKLPPTLSHDVDQWWVPSILSFNKTFIHCYKHIMLSKRVIPPNRCVRLMSSICKSISHINMSTDIIHRYYTNASYLSHTDIIPYNFDLAFNPYNLTIFDEEMRLKCNKIEMISRTPYYAHSVHALFYENTNNPNDDTKISKISRITPFLRSKKNKKIKTDTINDEKKQDNKHENKEKKVVHKQQFVNKIDLTPYVINISTPSTPFNMVNNNEIAEDEDKDALMAILSRTGSFDQSFSAPISAASTPRPTMNNKSNTVNLYQDEDMHSQHLPSMTLSAIMNNEKEKDKEEERGQGKLEKGRETEEDKQKEEEEEEEEEEDDDDELIPHQLRQCRQDSILSIIPLKQQQQQHQQEETEINYNDRKRWKGFFNFFGQWNAPHNINALDAKKSGEMIQNLQNKSKAVVQNANFKGYGEPDVYYSLHQHEQNELALPNNIFCDKHHFNTFLHENYGRYQLADYVLSPSQSHNIDAIYTNNNNNNNNIKSRFTQTDVKLTQKDFSAFAKLHASFLNLNQEINAIENDKMKKQGYAFYTNLPHNLCIQSINPRNLNDQHIDA